MNGVLVWEGLHLFCFFEKVNMKASALLVEAISLPVEERAYLVDCLLHTLNPPDASHAAAWAAAARRRLNDFDFHPEAAA